MISVMQSKVIAPKHQTWRMIRDNLHAACQTQKNDGLTLDSYFLEQTGL
jgi:hypothetical protein